MPVTTEPLLFLQFQQGRKRKIDENNSITINLGHWYANFGKGQRPAQGLKSKDKCRERVGVSSKAYSARAAVAGPRNQKCLAVAGANHYVPPNALQLMLVSASSVSPLLSLFTQPQAFRPQWSCRGS